MKMRERVMTGIMAAFFLSGFIGLAQEAWDGSSSPGNNNWSTGNNWADDTAPTNLYTGTVTFSSLGLGTNVVDQNWSVGSLYYTNSSLTARHVTDLGGNTLIISNGQLIVGYNMSNTVVTITNGTLQLGTARTVADLYTAWGQNISSANPIKGSLLTIQASINATNLRHLQVTKDDGISWPGANGNESVLNLSGATISSGGAANKLRTGGNLTLAGPAGNWATSGSGTLLLPPSLTDIDVGGYFIVAQGPNAARGTLDFGVGSQLSTFCVSNNFSIGGISGRGYLLNWPTGVNVRIGNPGAPVTLLLGNGNEYEVPSGSFGQLALTNGSFEAYLSQIMLGAEGKANMANSTGILDLASCPMVQIGAKPNEVRLPDLRLGSALSVPGQGSHGYGSLSLPGSITNIVIGNFVVGSDAGSQGILDLGTNSRLQSFWVTNSFLFGCYGKGVIQGIPTNGLRFAVGAAGAPVPMDLGCGTKWSLISPAGRITLSNALFSAYLTNLRIGDRLGGSSASIVGELNLTHSTLGDFKVNGDVRVGYSGAANSGYLMLPPGALNVGSNVTIGDSLAGSFGLMELHGSVVTAGKSVRILPTGIANVWLNGASAGFDVAGSTTNDFAIAAAARMNVVVQANPGPGAKQYWCLRMAGDQVSHFENLISSGLLTLNVSAMTPSYQNRFVIHYNGVDTILGIRRLDPGTLIQIR